MTRHDASLSCILSHHCLLLLIAVFPIAFASYLKFSFGVDMTAYPTIWHINHRLEKEESFKLAHPTSQIDCPADFC